MGFRSFYVVFAACLIAGCSAELAHKLSIAASFNNVRSSSAKYYIPPNEWPANGASKKTYPSYDERSMGVWLNVARIGYTWYRQKYMCPLIYDGSCSRVFDGSSNPIASSVPGFYDFNLGRVARLHCKDVVENCRQGKADHNDCNGTSANDRISKFTSWSSEIYINYGPGIGLFRGFGSVAAWVCDGYHTTGSSLPSLSECVNDAGFHPDGSKGTAGHRYGVMNQCANWGCGVYGESGSTSYATTCDCCSGSWCDPSNYTGLHIAAASHVGDPADTSKFLYMATILTTGITVSSVKVIEDDDEANKIDLPLLYQGTYGAIYASPSYDLLNDCRTYYFELTYGDTFERYPAEGVFYTYGMSCDENWNDPNSASTVSIQALCVIVSMLIAVMMAFM